MQVDEEHMLLSLTEDAKALIPQLLTRCGISVDAFRAALNDAPVSYTHLDVYKSQFPC